MHRESRPRGKAVAVVVQTRECRSLSPAVGRRCRRRRRPAVARGRGRPPRLTRMRHGCQVRGRGEVILIVEENFCVSR